MVLLALSSQILFELLLLGFLERRGQVLLERIPLLKSLVVGAFDLLDMLKIIMLCHIFVSLNYRTIILQKKK